MRKFITSVFLMTIFSIGVVNAQWPTKIEDNLEVTHDGNYPLSVLSDGDGGAFLLYGQSGYINDTIPTNTIWFLHIDKFGNKVGNEVRISDSDDYQESTKLLRASDGKLIVGMVDKEFLYRYEYRLIFFERVLIQKLDTMGNRLWNNGAYVHTDDYSSHSYELISSDDGGCIVSFIAEDTSSVYYELGFKGVQRISSDGSLMWGQDGIKVFEGNLTTITPKVFKSNSTDVIIANFQNSNSKSNFMKLDEFGEIVWMTESSSNYFFDDGIEDTQGGLFSIGIENYDNGSFKRIFVERLNSMGNYVWENPVELIDSASILSLVNGVFSNEEIGLLVFWEDTQIDYATQSYFQRVSLDGELSFELKEVKPFPGNNFIIDLVAAEDDIILLNDNFIVQKISVAGNKLWEETGVIFSENLDPCFTFPHLITDSNAGCLIFWQKCLEGIRAKQINRNGELGSVTEVKELNSTIPTYFAVSKNYPNPFNPITTINFEISKHSNLTVDLYNTLGEKIRTFVFSSLTPGYYSVEIDGNDLSSGMYISNFIFSVPNSLNKILFTQQIKMLLIK